METDRNNNMRSPFKREEPKSSTVNPFKNRNNQQHDERPRSPFNRKTVSNFRPADNSRFNFSQNRLGIESRGGRVSDATMMATSPSPMKNFSYNNGYSNVNTMNNPFQRNAWSNNYPYQADNTDRLNPFGRQDQRQIQNYGNSFQHHNQQVNNYNPFQKQEPEYHNPFKNISSNYNWAALVRTNPFSNANQQPTGGYVSNSPFYIQKPSPNLSELQRNPFANITKQVVQKESCNNNPFEKLRKDLPKQMNKVKENPFGVPIVNKPVYLVQNRTTMPQLSPMKQHLNNLKQINQQKPIVQAPPKTVKEVVTEVMKYFLESPILDAQSEAQADELTKVDIKHSIVKPLSQAFLSNIPTNDSFLELYNSDSMHDITLYFLKDGKSISTHKIVLSTSLRLKSFMEQQSKMAQNGKIDKIELSTDYDFDTFTRLLKLMYLGTTKIMDMSLSWARAIYLLAWKIEAKPIQKIMVIHYILPQLNSQYCLYILEDAYKRLKSADDSVKLLYGCAKIYWGRRLKNLLETQSEVILKMDRELVKVLISQGLYFITGEPDLNLYMKTLILKVLKIDMFEFSVRCSKDYERAVAYNYQQLDCKQQIEAIGFDPIKIGLLLGKNQIQELKMADKSKPIESKISDSSSASLDILEAKTPLENKIHSGNEINFQEPNFVINLHIDQNEVLQSGLTYFSEWFYSFSATWNLKIDVQSNGNVNVYLVERPFKKPSLHENTHGICIGAYQSNDKANLINNGRNALYPLNFKSVLFSVSVVDTRLTNEFKIFHSFCKDQYEIIGKRIYFWLSSTSIRSVKILLNLK